MRNQLVKLLHEHGINVGVHYPIPLHLQGAYRHLKYNKGHFPVTEKIVGEIISLPIFPGITNENIQHIVGVMKKCMTELKENVLDLEMVY